MERIPEPELMLDPVQAVAYARADFSEPHDLFVEQFIKAFSPENQEALVLDIGCGPADITVRMAKAFGRYRFHGVDGSAVMLREGERRIYQENLQDRIQLFQGTIPDFVPPSRDYSLIISNSLLHHLHRPDELWNFLASLAGEETRLFLMDLIRPETPGTAEMLVNTYSGNEPEILKRDFYNSLCAAFTMEEIRSQVEQAGLEALEIKQISDRHLVVYGTMKK